LVAGQYFGSDRDNLIMDLTNSNAKILLSNTKYALYPAWANGDVLIILARPTFFSSADEYWGINSQTGERLWKFAIPGQGRLAYSEVRSTAKGVFEVSCRADPNGCSWSALDPQTGIGTQTGQSSLGGASMRGTWDQDTLYLEGDQHLNVIDALSSQLLYQWP
jgi:hypothetical protein